MQTRMKNPALLLENANAGIQILMSSIFQSGISPEVLEFAGLRVGQMNNCELCIGQSLVKAESNAEIRERIQLCCIGEIQMYLPMLNARPWKSRKP